MSSREDVEYQIRAVTDEEASALHRAMGISFFFDPPPESSEFFALTAEFDRSRCVFDQGEIVGTSGAYSLQLSVPGGVVPTGGTTWVTVRPTHRRRGLLRAMMRAHIEDVRERAEPLAALWASESAIYGRFGYGLASSMLSFEIESAHAVFRAPLEAPGRVRLVGVDEARELLPRVYEPCARERPGHFARSETWWQRRTADPEWEREGATKLRYAVYEEDGAPRGYAQYRVRNAYDPAGLPAASALLIELQGVDSNARAAVWRHLLDLDLVKTMRAWNQPVDDDLPWLLADPRRLVTRQRDALWLRTVDLADALTRRSYRTEDRLVLRVQDEFCPWNDGSWELEAGPSGAQCKSTGCTADLALDAETLGALYLGGHGFAALARAGRVQGSDDALRRADALFGWDPAPWCPEIF